MTQIFYKNRKVYGTQKIKKVLENQGIRVSRRKIGRIMKICGLKSSYTTAYYKHHGTSCNEVPVKNRLNREFTHKNPLEAIVTDLTYVKVGKKWHYIYLILDLFNREIIGYACDEHKSSELVKKTFSRVPYSLTDVSLFYQYGSWKRV